MDGYIIVGVALAFATIPLSGYYLWHSHRMSKDPDYQELRRAAWIIRIRNTATIIAMLAFSGFSLLLASMPRLTPRTEEYITRDILSTYALYTGLAMVVTSIVLWFIGRKAEFDFDRLLRINGVKEKFWAGVKFNQRRKQRPKYKNRV